MNTIKNWMNKNGIEYTETTYGANYFNDHGLDLHFDGLTIGIDCTEYYTAEQIEKKIRKYCERYGYSIIQTGGFPGYHYMNIMRTDDWNTLRDYERYSREAQKECEKHIHFCHEYYGGDHAGLNEELGGIMEFFEEEYKRFLAA